MLPYPEIPSPVLAPEEQGEKGEEEEEGREETEVGGEEEEEDIGREEEEEDIGPVSLKADLIRQVRDTDQADAGVCQTRHNSFKRDLTDTRQSDAGVCPTTPTRAHTLTLAVSERADADSEGVCESGGGGGVICRRGVRLGSAAATVEATNGGGLGERGRERESRGERERERETEARLHDVGGGGLCDTKPVEMTMKLAVDFRAAGKVGSAERVSFNHDLTQDLSNASGLAPHLFEVVRVGRQHRMSAGSIVVVTRVHADSAMLVATNLQKQAHQTNSPLLSGLVTRHCEGILLPTVPPNEGEREEERERANESEGESKNGTERAVKAAADVVKAVADAEEGGWVRQVREERASWEESAREREREREWETRLREERERVDVRERERDAELLKVREQLREARNLADCVREQGRERAAARMYGIFERREALRERGGDEDLVGMAFSAWRLHTVQSRRAQEGRERSAMLLVLYEKEGEFTCQRQKYAERSRELLEAQFEKAALEHKTSGLLADVERRDQALATLGKQTGTLEASITRQRGALLAICDKARTQRTLQDAIAAWTYFAHRETETNRAESLQDMVEQLKEYQLEARLQGARLNSARLILSSLLASCLKSAYSRSFLPL